MFLDEGPRSVGKIGSSWAGNAVRIGPGGRAGSKRRIQMFGVLVCGVCFTSLSRGQPRQGGRSGKQVKFKVAGPCLGRRRREQGTRRAGRAACIKNPPVWGVGGRKQKTERKKEKERDQTKKRREGAKCVCVPGQGETEMLPGCVLFHFKLPAGLRVFSSKQSWN